MTGAKNLDRAHELSLILYLIPHETDPEGYALTFICQQCGECCSTMGEIIEIREETAPLCFRIGYTTTGEERQVEVDPDKKELFLRREETKTRSLACPFLRQAAPGRIICTVHLSRPDLCRQYSCFRILILGNEEKPAGKVMENTRILRTMDHHLREIWDGEVCRIADADERRWEERVEEVLSREGYRVIR